MAPSVCIISISLFVLTLADGLLSVATGIPRRIPVDDYYEGMLIPKDSTIFVPSWALHHAERHGYEDPFAFNPDRYLDHPKLANDYAGSADYNKRDKFF